MTSSLPSVKKVNLTLLKEQLLYLRRRADANFTETLHKKMQDFVTGDLEKLDQKQIPLKYLTISEHLDILGVKLFGNFIETRAKNGEILIKKVNDLINLWKSGKFMPLLDRPISINTYALSKIWYRASSINFKIGDIDTMQAKIKSWLTQDMFEKPQEMVLYRKKN